VNAAAKNVPVLSAAAVIEQVVRQVQNLCFTRDLAPVQWSALRYLAKAGPLARSVSGLASYSGVNSSSASRTIQLLRRKGLVTIEAALGDSRVKCVSLSPAGRELLNRDPLLDLAAIVQLALDADERVALGVLLEKILFELCPKPFRGEPR
jgi:DNA-binding MarR family transcriptional regulator